MKFRPIRQPCAAAKRISNATPSLLRRRLGLRLQQRRDIWSCFSLKRPRRGIRDAKS